MMRGLFLTILLVIAGTAFSQDPVISLNITTRDEDSGKKLSGATVIVKSGGSVFVTKSSASNGKVPVIDLPLGQNYEVYVKKDGYVTKMATIDAHYDYPEDLPPFVPFNMETSLFQKVDGVDFGFLENTPMVKFEMDQYGNQVWDKAALKEMLQKIEKLKEEIAEKKEEEEKKRKEFEQYVASGDKAFSGDEFKDAIENYDKALGLYDDADVKKKRDDAQKALDEANKGAELEKKFQDKMAEAKTAFDAKDYEKALGLYKEATAIKPDEQLPKSRISEIEKILKDLKDQQAQFDKYVADGDNAVSSEDFDNAIKNYESALEIKEDAGVKKKLEDAKKAKEDKEANEQAQKELEEKYNKLIADADKDFDGESYEDARTKYQEALDLKPAESHPASRISQIDDILKKRQEEQDAAKKLEEDYNKFITEGDAAFNSNDWDGAIAKYQEALKLKPGEKHPTDQIELAKQNKEKAANEKELNEQYDALMAEGKSLKEGEKYEDAIKKYQEALNLKPSEQAPKDRIAEIEKLIEDLASQKEKEEKYTALMAEGNDAQSKDKLEDALSKYKAALDLIPNDAEATKKIDEVKKLIADKKANEEQDAKFEELVKKGDDNVASQSYKDAIDNYTKALAIKDDAGVKTKLAEAEDLLKKQEEDAANEEKYNQAIKDADQLFAAKDWEKAIAKYEEAITYKDIQYPKDKIALAQKELANLADENEKEKMFTDLVAAGDELSGESKYDEAIRKYEEAINIKPDVDVSQKIADLKVKRDEELANKELQEKFDKKVKEADAAFNERNWEEAKALYKEALDIKADEAHPKDQLKEIDKRIEEEKANLADKEYQAIIKKADELRDAENFPEAISKYNEALDLRSGDSYAQGEIDKINELIEQREQEEADKAAKEQKYKDLIAAADKKFNEKKYQDALADYQEALKLKPSETHPTNRVKEIQDILNELSADSAKKAEYETAIKKADKLFAEESYKQAKTAYQDALALNYETDYPTKKIAECDEMMKAESEDEVEKEYQKILKVAQEKMDAKDFDRALELYTRAKDMKPSDPLPQQKIDEINKKLADLEAQKAKDEQYKAAIAKADKLFGAEDFKAAKTSYEDALMIKPDKNYPKTQIELCNEGMKGESVDEVEKQYQKILKAAQKYFDEKDYEKSLDYYNRAKGMKPSDPLPQQRIDEINQILKDLENEKSKRDRYNKLIQDADNLFEQSEWQKAMKKYMDALDLYSNEKWPKDQVEKCREAIKNNGDTANKQYRKLIDKADEYFASQDYEKAKGLYKRAIGIKPSDQYPKDKIKEIDNILNPPKEKINKSMELTDYGPPTNETPVDMEAMLIEANEQAEEFELQRIYQQREDSQEALKEWTIENENESYRTKDAADEVTSDVTSVKYAGEQRREETNLEVEKWRGEIVETNTELKTIQDNDVQFQNRKLEAMEMEISETNYSNDKQREGYEEDVERIKVEKTETIRSETIEQENVVMADKEGIDLMTESHISSDPNNDVDRLNTVVEVEDMQVVNINKRNEDTWDQEDENFNTKREQNLLVEDIIANKLDSDLPRQDTELIVEETTVSYQKREQENSKDQYNENWEVKNQTEKMEVDFSEDAYQANEDRVGYEKVVEETTISYQKREVSDANDQYDNTIQVKNQTEKMAVDLEEDAFNANEDRAGYEKVVEETTVSYQKREEKDANDQYDNTIDVRNETEKMSIDLEEDAFNANEDRAGYEKVVEQTTVSYSKKTSKDSKDQTDIVMGNDDHIENLEEDITDFNKDANENQEENADKNLEAMEEHIEHINDDKEQNDDALIESENKIESLKDVDVKNITPEIANELGKKFPEGVTEESFSINDSRGIMKAFVVRRVVVIDGVGTVYEKTQTRYGAVTYTRNGQAISEFEWDDQSNSGPRN